MGRYLYTIKDKETGEVLFVGGEGASAKFLDCEPSYMSALGRNASTEKRTIYGDKVITREWTDTSVECMRCGITIKNTCANQKYCTNCARMRRKLSRNKGIQIQYLQEDGILLRIQEKQQLMQERCHGCIYFGAENYMNATCNYLFIVGHSRGCPPGEGCTVRKER